MAEQHASMEQMANRMGRDIHDGLLEAIRTSEEPERAAVRLNRWLAAAANPVPLVEALENTPVLATMMLRTLVASSLNADILAQNPELGAALLDPTMLASPPSPEALRSEGESLLAAATSTPYRMDRLRFLKQKWGLILSHAELNEIWPQEQIWRCHSDLADSLLLLAMESHWTSYAQERGLDPKPPLQVVAFGKLGSRELNFSSDIDLLYIIADDLDPAIEVHASRFAVALGRWLAEPMGRGSLYRVDLRLRPFGSRGAMVSGFGAVEIYYERYAETWEHLALLRSRILNGEQNRWEELRRSVCFGQRRGTWHIEELVHQRQRLEEIQKGDDLKRGPGGIRDIEFLVGSLQLVHGPDHPTIRGRSTPGIIESMLGVGILSPEDAGTLIGGYGLLRRIENTLQMEAGRQTHTLPENPESQEVLSRVLGQPSWEAMSAELNGWRSRIREVYQRLMVMDLSLANARDQVLIAAGLQDEALSQWLDLLPESASFYSAVAASESGLPRLLTVLNETPALVPELRQSLSVTEQILTGEVLQPADFPTAPTGPLVRDLRLRVVCNWLLGPEEDLPHRLSEVTDWVIRSLAQGLPLSVVAFGSLAIRESGWHSDADLVLIGDEGISSGDADRAAKEFLQRWKNLQSAGSPLTADYRLRPLGRDGARISSREGLKGYLQGVREPWERVAFQRCRIVCGEPTLEADYRESCFNSSISQEDFDNLLHIRSRLANERVTSLLRPRHLKFGAGALVEIEWMLALTALINPKARPDHLDASTEERLRMLVHAGELNAFEFEQVNEAHRFLNALRWRIDFLGYPEWLMPENPDRLNKLAEHLNLTDGNALLAMHQSLTEASASLVQEQIERLKERIR